MLRTAMSNSDKTLFTRHEHALDKTDEICPECASKLQIKHGKSGAFLGCSNYPNCQYSKQLHEHERVEDKILAGSECPLCQSLLAVKQGRYGMFIGCTNYPECHYIEEDKAKEAGVACPQCKKQGKQGELHEKTNRFGKVFYGCDQYPQCKYIVNYPPVAQLCPECSWSILVKRKMAAGEVLICPQKHCHYKVNI